MCEEGLKLTTLLKCRICKVPCCEVESREGVPKKLTSEAIDGLNRGKLANLHRQFHYLLGQMHCPEGRL